MIDSHWSIAEKFLKKWFWLLGLSFLIWPIGYLVKITISSELSVEEVWILYWIISLITILIGYNDFWITESLKFFVPRYYEEKRFDKIKTILALWFLTQLSSSIILTIIFYFWADFIGNHYFHNAKAIESIKIFSFFFVWINIFQLLNTFFLAVQNTFLYRFSELVRIGVVLLWTALIFFTDSWSLINYTYSRIFWLYFGIIFTIWIFITKYYFKYLKGSKIIKDKKFIKEVLWYAILVLVGSQAWTILSQIDMQMIIYMLWVKDAWYYTNYLSLIWIFFIFIWPLFTFLLPVFSELSAKKQIDTLKSLKSELSHIFLFFGISYATFCFIFWSNIAYILFWEKFIFSWEILKYSMPFLAFNFILQVNFNLLAWLWKVKERIKVLSYWILLNCILNFFLIQIMWVSGAALATGFWWLYIVYATEKILWKEFQFQIDLYLLAKNICIFLCIWYVFKVYLSPFFSLTSRTQDLWILVWIISIWTLIYIMINYKFFHWVVINIKKLKNAKRQSLKIS